MNARNILSAITLAVLLIVGWSDWSYAQESVQPPATEQPATSGFNINTCPEATLLSVKGIGPVKAQAIISARPIKDKEALDAIKGIGPATLQAIMDAGATF
jgi:DNA uptake protein ComE-like DNA-binding protein